MSPALEQKLAFTATLVGSYEAAAQDAANWGCPVDDSVIHALVQRLGAKAEVQTQERLKESPVESQPQRAASELALLMVDGWFARFRGPGWGKKKTKKERVEWHEIKNGVFYLHEQAGRTEGGRGGDYRQNGSAHAGRFNRPGAATPLGGAAGRTGTSPADLGPGRWHSMDLESQR